MDDVGGKALALLLKVLLEARPVFLNNLVEKSFLRSMALVAESAKRPFIEIVLR